MKLVIVIPAFNESQVIYKVLTSLPRKLAGITSIESVVVDDGSIDGTSEQALKARVTLFAEKLCLLKHSLNRGVGAATKTGIEWSRRRNADVVVTFDADGQHDPKDIAKVLNPILKREAEIVIGSRFKKRQKIPMDRLILNWFANLATFILFGVFSTDSQSGLRAFSRKAIELIDFKSDRMEFSSEILSEAKRHNLKILEVPTTAIYTDYSRSKGQKNTNAIPIIARLLVKFLR